MYKFNNRPKIEAKIITRALGAAREPDELYLEQWLQDGFKIVGQSQFGDEVTWTLVRRSVDGKFEL